MERVGWEGQNSIKKVVEQHKKRRRKRQLWFYRVSIKIFPVYKHSLQENYVECKHFFFQNVTQLKKFFYNTLVHFNMCSFCVPRSFLVISFCNQGKTLCSPCTLLQPTYELLAGLTENKTNDLPHNVGYSSSNAEFFCWTPEVSYFHLLYSWWILLLCSWWTLFFLPARLRYVLHVSHKLISSCWVLSFL